MFHWPYYVQNCLWYRVHFFQEKLTIRKFEMARCNDGWTVFLGTRSDGNTFTANPFRDENYQFSFDTSSIEGV